jgi:hypothetical protein
MSSNHVHDGLQTDEPTFISFGEERNAAGFFQIFWEARRSERMRTESWEGTEGHRPGLYRCRRCTVDTEQGDGARAHGLAIGHWRRWLCLFWSAVTKTETEGWQDGLGRRKARRSVMSPARCSTDRQRERGPGRPGYGEAQLVIMPGMVLVHGSLAARGQNARNGREVRGLDVH